MSGDGGRDGEGTCRSVPGRGSWVTQGKYGLAFHWQIPREALAVPHLSRAPLPRAAVPACAEQGGDDEFPPNGITDSHK